MIAGRGAAYALLGLAGLLLAIAVSSGWSGVSRIADREDDRGAVEAAAAAFVVAYATFDFREPDEYTAHLKELTSGELRDAVATARIDPRAVEQQRSTSAVIESVSVTALTDVAATASVRARHQRAWLDPQSGQVIQQQVIQHVSCRLVHESGRWLVAELLLLGEAPAGTEGAR